MKLRTYCLIVTCILLMPSLVIANQVREKSLDEKVASATFVVIGRAISTSHIRIVGKAAEEFTTILVETALKGSPPKTVEVLTKGTISEVNPDCCELGGRYLFFLVNIAGDKYASVNGRFGIVRIAVIDAALRH